MLELLKSIAIALAAMSISTVIGAGITVILMCLYKYHPFLVPFGCLGVVFVLWTIIIHIIRNT